MKNFINKIVFVIVILGVQCIIVQNAEAQQQWVQTNGPSGGGDVYYMTAAGSSAYTYCYPKGMYRSSDDGQTWKPIGYPDYSSIQSLAMDGTDVYAGMMSGLFRYSTGTGLWTNAAPGFGSDYMGYHVRIFGQTICIGMGAGVFISRDKGATWKNTVLGGGDVAYDFLDFGSTMLAATNAGAYRTIDNGTTWTNVSAQSFPWAIHAFATMGNDVYAGTTGGVYKSSDFGSTWTDVSSGMNRYFLTVDGLKVLDNVLVAITTNGVYRSTDKGATWVGANSGLKYNYIGSSGGYFVTSLAATGNSFCVGTIASGIFRSTDHGVTWKPSNNGIIGTTVTTLHGGDGYVLAFAQNNGIFRTTDKGSTWELMNTPTASVSAFLAVGSDILAATAKGVWRSSDMGLNWQQTGDTLASTSVSSLARCDSLIFAGTNQGLYVSRDLGRTWTIASATFSQNAITALAANGSTIYASTQYAVYVSFNSGGYWSRAVDISASAMAAYGSSLFILNNYKIFQVQGNGQSWSMADVGVVNALSLAVVGSKLYVGTSMGVYNAPMNGTAWKWEVNLTENYAYALAASGSDLYLGTYQAGVYRLLNGATSVHDDGTSGIATGFDLAQNYPNPFNPSTTITYQLAQEGRISVTVSDVLGRECAVLVDALQPAGSHAVVFDGSRYPSGTYFYTLMAGGARVSKTMFLLK
jgi:photosystem II stability/assembly factor-like uncharacterized protein